MTGPPAQAGMSAITKWADRGGATAPTGLLALHEALHASHDSLRECALHPSIVCRRQVIPPAITEGETSPFVQGGQSTRANVISMKEAA